MHATLVGGAESSSSSLSEKMAAVMPTKLQPHRPPPLSIPLPAPNTDPHSIDCNIQSSTPDNMGSGKRRRPSDDGNTTDESEGEVPKAKYECRFCNMWFEKSQALGGHMNRHRQEREREQYQHAHQLVNSLAQQQMPRTWSTLAADASDAGVATASQLARLSTQMTMGAKSPRVQPQVSPISFGSSRLPVTTPSDVYLPTNSPSSSMHQQWNIDGVINPSRDRFRPGQSGHQQIPNTMDVLSSGCLSSVMQQQPVHDAGSFGCPGATFNNQQTMASLLNSRAGLGGTASSMFQESFQGGSNAAGHVPLGHDHQNMRLNDVPLRQFSNVSSNQAATLIQSSNVDVRQSLRAPVPNSTFPMQPRTPGKAAPGGQGQGQYPGMSPPMLLGQSFNNPGAGGGSGGFGVPQAHLAGTTMVHDLNILDFSPNHAGEIVQAQYATANRQRLPQTSSGSVASGSFESHEPPASPYVGQQMKVLPTVDSGSRAYSRHPTQIMVSSAAVQQQILNTTTLVREVGDGSNSESTNTTLVAESGDISGMSGAPARYQSTDFSSGSGPEYRPTQNDNSPSAQTNDHSPPSQEYGSN